MNNKVTILDYGMCNLLNVARALQHVGADVSVTEDAKVAAAANRLIVPGVGAFRDSVREVTSRGFDDVIRSFIESERPFLGICVGMQMLFDVSEEFGVHEGLAILPGRVTAVPNVTLEGDIQRVPHIGWNTLVEPEGGRDWQGTLLSSYVDKNPAVYFVHSFAAVPTNPSDRLADCVYGGHRICASVQRNNIMATQFHPERSGLIGLETLKLFTQMK
jgi:glutamine amidotransferase